MPHIIIEYARELADDQRGALLVQAVHDAVAKTGIFDVANIKTRAWPVLLYRVGDNDGPFIHIQCRIHGGRSEAQKRALSEAVLGAVRAQGLAAHVITVEVAELDRASYAKHVRTDGG